MLDVETIKVGKERKKVFCVRLKKKKSSCELCKELCGFRIAEKGVANTPQQ